MAWLKALCIAFSIYSRIPVPIFEWKEEDMRYHLLFFPWIGLAIGGLMMGWESFCVRFEVAEIARVLILAAIPLLVTGGFHVDGYMDTMDAFHSYKPKEEKLVILKDPHIGAFAVIMLALLGMVYIAALSSTGRRGLEVYSAAFFLVRCLSAIAVITFPAAKKQGMLYTFSSAAQGKGRRILLAGLWAEFFVCAGVMCLIAPVYGLLLVGTALAVLGYYRYITNRELGGITGDTAGYFVTICECAMLVAAALLSLLG